MLRRPSLSGMIFVDFGVRIATWHRDLVLASVANLDVVADAVAAFIHPLLDSLPIQQCLKPCLAVPCKSDPKTLIQLGYDAPRFRSAVFLIHVALEAPLVVQTFLSPTSLPFMQMTNTTIVLLKVRAVSTLLSLVLPMTRVRVPRLSCTPPSSPQPASPLCSCFLSQVRPSRVGRFRQGGWCSPARDGQSFSPANALSRSRYASITVSHRRYSFKLRGSCRIRLARGSSRRYRSPSSPPVPGAWFASLLRTLTRAMGDRLQVTPENVWGTFHGVVGLLMVVWWQLTLQNAKAFRAKA